MRVVVRFLALLVFALSLFSAQTASAQAKGEKQTIQVLTLYSDTAYEQAEALSIALKRAVDRSSGWTLGKGDFSLEVLTAALGCKTTPDEACLKKIADRVKATHFVWGSLEKQGKDVAGTLHLYDGASGKETQVKYSENLSDASDETLLQIAEVAFAELVGTAPGKLVITSKDAKTVSVDGAAPTAFVDGRAELTLPGGEHTVVLRAPGFGDESRDVTVVQGESSELEIAMRSTAAQVGGGGEVGMDTGKPMNTKKVIGLAGMGVGAALLVGAVYSAIKVNSINNDDADENPYTIIVQGVGALSGTFDVGGGAMDFADPGAAFDALELSGIGGPVVFNVFTGTYTSNASCEFGHKGAVDAPVNGASATNTITFQAAPGQTPVISGSGATDPFALGVSSTVSLNQQFVRFIGITFTGGIDTGLSVLSTATQLASDLEVRRCSFHSVTAGPGMLALGLGGNNLNDVLIENNF
ncbi:MAG: hypothetical protein KC492_38975, partial [Myxococcales bacterium]|nr:hypothetical protein [Myxococcales bacterium]